ncbi:MAG: chemotaxis-specific protein-glutamate methyltransferase CheB [Myxococcales bacterium]|nr:chemotaxis-specific protein-glutamate methyltransferase CheB [Myxococcales bacterium]
MKGVIRGGTNDTMKPVRVLVVDDSVVNRRVIAKLLSALPGVSVVGAAADGDEALQAAHAMDPDLITLDLEMPRMDGFTFLRLLMANRPTPVVVISSHAGRDHVFRALELGAIDFVAKPSRRLDESSQGVGEQLEKMVALVRGLSPKQLRKRPPPLLAADAASRSRQSGIGSEAPAPPAPVIAIGASTGGPRALLQLFQALPDGANAAIVVAQHMPERFTRTFAERLARQSAFRVREAAHRMVLMPGDGLVCPGGRRLELGRVGPALQTRVTHPASTDRYAPSADRLLASVAAAAGEQAVGVILTGMGDDGARGVREIKERGGRVLVESRDTAVLAGMPEAAIRTGCVDEVLELPKLIERVCQLVAPLR